MSLSRYVVDIVSTAANLKTPWDPDSLALEKIRVVQRVG